MLAVQIDRNELSRKSRVERVIFLCISTGRVGEEREKKICKICRVDVGELG